MPTQKRQIQVGSRVKERAASGRTGVVLKAFTDTNTRNQWCIQFDGVEEAEIKTSRQLAIVLDATDDRVEGSDTNNDGSQQKVPPTGRSNQTVVSSTAASPATSSNMASKHIQSKFPPLEVEHSTSDKEGELGGHSDSQFRCEKILDYASVKSDSLIGVDRNGDVPSLMYTVTEDIAEDALAEETNHIESEDEYARKTAVYIAEKAALVRERWAVEFEQDKPSFGVGSRVKARSQVDGRVGKITKRSIDGVKWMVRFDGSDEDEERAHQSLEMEIDSEDPKCGSYKWTVVEHSDPNPGSAQPTEYDDIGLGWFDFDAFADAETVRDTVNYQYPYLALLQRMWPGYWETQLNRLNATINAENKRRKTADRTMKQKLIRELSLNEWWVFVGILIVAAPHGFGGRNLFRQSINFGKGGKNAMTESRFNDIRAMFPSAFQDLNAKKENDPWYMIRDMVDGFNENRKQTFAASTVKVLDQSMSAWRSHIRTGGLPRISYIPRKTEDIGTEFKDVACGVTGVMLHLEIQEEVQSMETKKYSDQYGRSAACTFRLAESSEYSGRLRESRRVAMGARKPEHFLGDSWFTSIPVAEWMSERGHAYTGALKTYSKYFPKEAIAEKMKEWPSGSSLVMECKTPKGHDLVAVGYRDNNGETLFFLATKNAGSTRQGTPEANLPDGVGNAHFRRVERPTILSHYFKNIDSIESHNHIRQDILKLEKCWVTQDCWFRLVTTILGMTVTDCWRVYTFSMTDKKEREVSSQLFVERMAMDLLCNQELTDPTAVGNLKIGCDPNLPFYLRTADEINRHVNSAMARAHTTISAVCCTLEEFTRLHTLKPSPGVEGQNRCQEGACRNQDCPYKGHKTRWICAHPRCREFIYKSKGKFMKGMFYHQECFLLGHHKEIHGGGFKQQLRK